jgi:hypothetical protein
MVVVGALMEQRLAGRTPTERRLVASPDDSGDAEGSGSVAGSGGTEGGGGGIVSKYAKILQSEATTRWPCGKN